MTLLQVALAGRQRGVEEAESEPQELACVAWTVHALFMWTAFSSHGNANSLRL